MFVLNVIEDTLQQRVYHVRVNLTIRHNGNRPCLVVFTITGISYFSLKLYSLFGKINGLLPKVCGIFSMFHFNLLLRHKSRDNLDQ